MLRDTGRGVAWEPTFGELGVSSWPGASCRGVCHLLYLDSHSWMSVPPHPHSHREKALTCLSVPQPELLLRLLATSWGRIEGRFLFPENPRPPRHAVPTHGQAFGDGRGPTGRWLADPCQGAQWQLSSCHTCVLCPTCCSAQVTGGEGGQCVGRLLPTQSRRAWQSERADKEEDRVPQVRSCRVDC